MAKMILIVDDHATNRLILKETLKREYDILEAAGGEEALNILAARHASISAVLLDIGMPDMDGYEVLDRIRSSKQLAKIPVIMVTASEDNETRIKSLALGANDFVIKPYSPEILCHCLQNNIALHEAASTVFAMQRDKLTGLYSRESFFDKVREMAPRHESSYYVMACFDIEKFKVINDQYGTQKGDEVLQHIADSFREGFEPVGGICCRIFADNFAVFYPTSFMDTPEIEAVRRKASHVDGLVSPVYFCIGRYIVDDVTMSPATMYDRAILAAASVKGRYDEKIALYNDAMREQIVREQEIVFEMEDALKAGQFEVWFQPQYNHSTGARIGAEALVRWRHPQKGLLPPSEFIGIFEQNGFIYPLDKYVWEEVCRRLRRWIDSGIEPLPISVNISRYDLLRPDIVDVLNGLISKYRLPIDLLRLEITESAFSESAQRIVEVVKALLRCGFTVEIDDFGSGYSSLNTLKDVPAQIIKLDMKFLESSDDTQRGGNIVESVVRMAKWLGMSVIAEGVETLEQADYLRSIGCYYMQGYLYARPMPAKRYEEHCSGSSKEERLLSLETVENLDNNSFWDPKSMDTLIFNSYVGGACIYEFHNGRIELLRATEKYAQVIGSAGMTVEDALKLDWSNHLDEATARRINKDLQRSIATRNEVTGEYVFFDLPNCPHETHLRSTMRVIASAGERRLVYCTNENVTAQRQAERKARNLAEQLKTIMDSVDCGISAFAIDGNQAESYFVNDKYFEIIGYSKEEFSTELKNIFDTIYPDDRQRVFEIAQRANEVGKITELVYRVMRKNGAVVWVKSTISTRIFEGIDKPVQVTIFTDINAEKLAEQELQAAAAQIQNMMDDMPGGFVRMRIAADGSQKLAYVNDGFAKLLGLTREEALTIGPGDIDMRVHPDDADIFKEANDAVAGMLETGETRTTRYRLKRGDGSYIWLSVLGRVTKDPSGNAFLNVYYADASQHMREEETQRSLPLLLSTIMEASNDFVFAKDKDFRYICCSPAFLKIAGLTDERDVVGRTDFDIFPADMAEQFRKNDLALFESDKPLVDFDETIHAPDGTIHYCLASKHILRDAAGKRIGIYGISRDITKERGAFDQLHLVNDSIPGGIATYAVKGDSIRIAYCNDGFCKLFGGTREGLENRGDIDPLNWVHEEDRASLVSQIHALVHDDVPLDAIYRIRVLGNGIKWINEKGIAAERRGDTVLFNAILLDITERQNYNERLRISEEENNLALQHGGSIVCRYDVAERSLTVSPSVAAAHSIAEKTTDVPYAPVRLGQISHESADAYIGFFEAICNGSKAGTVLYQQRFSNGWRWIEAKSSTIFSDDGMPVKAVISLFDVTERLEKETIYKKWQHSLEDRAPASYTLFRCNLNKNTSYETKEGTLFFFDVDDAGISFNDRAKTYANKCVHEDDRDKYIAFLNSDTMLASYYRGKRSNALDYRELLPGGGERWLRLCVDLVEYPNSTDVEAYLMYENIDAAKKNELQTKQLSETDPLTGILNRMTFTESVNQILEASSPEAKHALLMMDIDGFKQVNDVFGHAAGDRTLIELANGVRSIIRSGDLVARLGGDEFVVFMVNVQDANAAITKAKQIRAIARKSFSMEVQISVSIGIAYAPHDGIDFDTLYRKADAALYHVKGSGKDNQAVYAENMADEHLAPEPDAYEDGGTRPAEKRRRMLIVDDSSIDHALLQNIFKDEFIIEKAQDGVSALIRLRHYGSAISIVLLDLMMPGMDGFAVLEKMQESFELRSIPVIIVSGDESRETCLAAIRKGATDFITKPIDAELLRIRVRSAISKAENERLRAKNCLLEAQSQEIQFYESFLESPGIAFIEYNWLAEAFTYHPSVSKSLAGTYNGRPLWQILLSDTVADAETVRDMQQLVRHIAQSNGEASGSRRAILKTPQAQKHRFRFDVRKMASDYQFANRLILSLVDLDYELPT